jgi:hypothetical protein
MKLKNRKNASTSNEAKNNETRKPFTQMLKEDLFKVIWLVLYLTVVAFILYISYSILPILFSYAYSAIGILIGIDFTSLSNADLAYWLLISLSVGAVFIALLVMLYKKLFAFITDKMFVKHVLRKGLQKDEKSSNIININDKK